MRLTTNSVKTSEEAARPTAFNRQVAGLFRDFAELLQLQDGNPFRIDAYRRAAQMLESLGRDLREILSAEGADGLTRLPTIGEGLAASIAEIARTGRFAQLDRLRGTSNPRNLFRTVPGIGPVLSQKIHDMLHVDTLEGLELAAHDGRLASIPGVGPRRAEAIKAQLASMLKRRRVTGRPYADSPPVAMLLDVDDEYRTKALAGALPKLAPRRFNPKAQAWLPVLHTERRPWHFSALFSNTARAHELKKTDDWVVVYFYDDGHREGQCTIVTESKGELSGRRVVRGRESECLDAYTAGYASRRGA